MKISAILDILIAVPQLAYYIKKMVSAIVVWYVQKQTGDTLVMIADAAALAARAQTDEDRFKAAEKWRAALSNTRYGA